MKPKKIDTFSSKNDSITRLFQHQSMSKTILSIEDDPDILAILEIIFQDEGFVLIANSKGMTVEEIALVNPDVILLDVRIAGFEKTGPQLCKELKAYTKTKHLPIILLSAERDLPQLAADCQADSYVNKPFDINGLVELVGNFTR